MSRCDRLRARCLRESPCGRRLSEGAAVCYPESLMRFPPPLLVREARVRREYAHLYNGWDVRVWTPAAKVAEWVRRQSHSDALNGSARLPDDQFEFRGGFPRKPGLRARTRRND